MSETVLDGLAGGPSRPLVWNFDRFARSLNQLMSGLEMCRALGIDFVSVSEPIDTSLPSGGLVFQMIGAVAQFERSLVAGRVNSGFADARAKGGVDERIAGASYRATSSWRRCLLHVCKAAQS